MADYEISLGIKLDTSNLQTQINEAGKGKEIPVQVRIENLKEVKEQIEGLEKGNSNLELNFNTDKLESSLEDVKKSVSEIKRSLGTVGQVGGVNGIERLDNSISQINITAKNSANTIQHMRDVLSKAKFNNTSIDLVTKDLEQMGIAVSNVTTKIGKKAIDVSVKGIDDLGRVVTILKKFDYESGNITSVGKTISQSFETSADAAKKEIKEINEAYSEIYNIQSKIGSLEVDLISAKAKDDVKTIDDINNEIGRLRNNLSSLDTNGVYSSRFTDAQKADLKELNELIKYSKKQAQNKVDYKLNLDAAKKEIKEINEAYKKLQFLAKEMGQIDVKIAGLDADKDEIRGLQRVLNELESEYNDLYEVTQKNLSVDQLKELDQIFANSIDEIRNFKNELSSSVESQELTSGLEKLKSLTKEISQLKIDIFNFEDSGNIERASIKLDELENKAAELRAELQKKFPTVSFDEIDDISKKGADALDKLVNKAAEAKAKLAEGFKVDIEVGKFDNEISNLEERFRKLSSSSKDFEKLEAAIEDVKRAYKEMESAAGTGDEVADAERLIRSQEEYAEAIKKATNLLRIQDREQKRQADIDLLSDKKTALKLDMTNWLEKNSRAVKEYGNEIKRLMSLLDNLGELDFTGFNDINRSFNLTKKTAERFGKTGLTVFDQLKTKIKEYASYLSAAELFMYAEQALRSMFEQVKLIDSAMTELKKVTNESDASYAQFLDNAGTRAKELGTTIDGLINSTADFARLGYDFKDAQGLAEIANIYAVVGDDVEGVEGATESLISTLAAFKDEMNGLSNTDFAMSIIDVFNELGNNFAISSGGLGEALERSASSLAAANNTLAESAALITAANTVVQNPEKVGRLLPTIKMAISVKLQRWTRPRKDFISILTYKESVETVMVYMVTY